MVATCECAEDGFCQRYKRDMCGRMRELCRGIDVDLGTAAAFREQWQREAGGPMTTNDPPRLLLLKADQAVGDAVAMTAAIHALHRAHPGKYLTAVESYWPEVFEHNPDVMTNLMPGSGLELGWAEIQMHYPAFHKNNDRAVHFMQGWCEFLASVLGVDVPLATDRPLLYFADPVPPQVEDYWLVCSGGKMDMTNKLWGRDNYQRVVDILKGTVKFVQIGGSKPPMAWNKNTEGFPNGPSSQSEDHPRLLGAVDMVGATTLRELFDLVRRARGVLCGVSLPMHVAAGLDRPAVVVAGGREPVAWNAYPKQQYVHTVGALQCSDTVGHVGRACLRSRVVPLGDNPTLDKDTCERPAGGLPECMRMISPATIAELILRYDRQYDYSPNRVQRDA